MSACPARMSCVALKEAAHLLQSMRRSSLNFNRNCVTSSRGGTGIDMSICHNYISENSIVETDKWHRAFLRRTW
jgi:hypothetical protein